MSNDLVTRLRQAGEWEPVGDGTTQWESSELCVEAADVIEQLRKELKQVRKDKDHLRKIVGMAFTQAGGCIAGCRGACMCTCGYEHYAYIVREEEKHK